MLGVVFSLARRLGAPSSCGLAGMFNRPLHKVYFYRRGNGTKDYTN